MQLRIGVNLGDVIVDGDDLYGDGVNLGRTLEALAEPGGICISEAAYQQVRQKLPLAYKDMGEQRVKNFAEPVRVYGVSPRPRRQFARRKSRGGDRPLDRRAAVHQHER